MDESTKQIWESIIVKPKWYAGIRNKAGGFYTAQAAADLKKRFKQGSVSWDIIETIFAAHGYTLIKQWVRKVENW